MPESAAPAVRETQLVHDAHRAATAALADAVRDPAASPQAVVELRASIVAALEHHHRSEDHEVWPVLAVAAPELAGPLEELSREHERLDAALEGLRGAPVLEGGDGRLRRSAEEVRHLVHEHLAHEEPILFPALEAHVSDDAWAQLSRRIVDAAPQVGIDLFLWFLHDVDPGSEIDLILRHLPPEAVAGVPVLLERAAATLATLPTGTAAADR